MLHICTIKPTRIQRNPRLVLHERGNQPDFAVLAVNSRPYMLAIRLELLVLSHIDEYFFWQYLHVPHAIWKETTTLSPGARVLTWGPMRSTMPLRERSASTQAEIDESILGTLGRSTRMNSCPRISPFCSPSISE